MVGFGGAFAQDRGQGFRVVDQAQTRIDSRDFVAAVNVLRAGQLAFSLMRPGVSGLGMDRRATVTPRACFLELRGEL